MIRIDCVFCNFDRRIAEILGRIHIDDCKKINCFIERFGLRGEIDES